MIPSIQPTPRHEVPLIAGSVLLLVTAIALSILLTQGMQLTPSLLAMTPLAGLSLMTLVVATALRCRKTTEPTQEVEQPKIEIPKTQSSAPVDIVHTPVNLGDPLTPASRQPRETPAIVEVTQPVTIPNPVAPTSRIANFREKMIEPLFNSLETFFVAFLNAHGRAQGQNKQKKIDALKAVLADFKSFANEVIVDPQFMMSDMLRHCLEDQQLATNDAESYARTYIIALTFGTEDQIKLAKDGWEKSKERESLVKVREFFAKNTVEQIHAGFVDVMVGNYDLPYPKMEEVAKGTLQQIWPKSLTPELKDKIAALKKQAADLKSFRQGLIDLLYHDRSSWFGGPSLLGLYFKAQPQQAAKFAQDSIEELLEATLIKRLCKILQNLDQTIRFFRHEAEQLPNVTHELDGIFLLSEATGFYDPTKVVKAQLISIAQRKIPEIKGVDASTQAKLASDLSKFKGHPLNEAMASKKTLINGLWAADTLVPDSVLGWAINTFAGNLLPPTKTKSGKSISELITKLLGPINGAVVDGLLDHSTHFHKEVRGLAYKHTGPATDKLKRITDKDETNWDEFLGVIQQMLGSIQADFPKTPIDSAILASHAHALRHDPLHLAFAQFGFTHLKDPSHQLQFVQFAHALLLAKHGETNDWMDVVCKKPEMLKSFAGVWKAHEKSPNRAVETLKALTLK